MLGVGDGGTPVRSWRRPGRGGVGTFQEPAVAQVVLHQDHRLQESELSLLPHEPENLAKDTSGGDCPVELEPGATEHAVLEAGGPARALKGAGTVTLGSEEAPAQVGRSLSADRSYRVSWKGWASQLRARGVTGTWGLVSLGPVGSSEEAGLMSPGSVGSPGPAGPMEIAPGSLEHVGWVSLGPAGPLRGHPVGMALSLEPGTMPFIQLDHEDLLADLGRVAVFPVGGPDLMGFWPHPGWAWPLTQRRSEGRWPPWRTPMGRAGHLQSRGQRSLRGSLHPGPGGAWAAASGDVLAASGPWSFKAGRPSRRTLCAAVSPGPLLAGSPVLEAEDGLPGGGHWWPGLAGGACGL
uniref:protein mono-ADP-ribosyltransferase PARP10 isoform X1 n=1 Tax=Panthera onca TaxID=9690 RepID=UPI002955B8A9|nr:protein mono-ADP-ribosyltransferase PARP10 isoform X1 [Panthera onca]